MKRLVIVLALLVVLIAGTLGYVFLSVAELLDRPVQDGPYRFTVASGSSLRKVLRDLEERGAIEKPSWIYYYARYQNLTGIRSGQYELKNDETPRDLLTMLATGRVLNESFSIPEGYNRWQIRDLLAAESWIDVDKFDALCDDREFLQSENVPGPSCEGYLFPETYRFARGVSARTIFKTMFAEFRRALSGVREELGSGPLDLGPLEFTTLASIVEKETGAGEERPRIACVFYNRLRADPEMRLQTDPTVIYAATLEDPEFDGNIRTYHLKEMQNPYNTYLNEGLPPGPIASAGRAALRAVAKPSQCQDLFFVSMNNGRHVFCPTYECHLKNVQKWQVDYFRRKKNRER